MDVERLVNMSGKRASAIPEASLLRRISKSPLNMDPRVDLAVNGREGMSSATGLGMVR